MRYSMQIENLDIKAPPNIDWISRPQCWVRRCARVWLPYAVDRMHASAFRPTCSAALTSGRFRHQAAGSEGRDDLCSQRTPSIRHSTACRRTSIKMKPPWEWMVAGAYARRIGKECFRKEWCELTRIITLRARWNVCLSAHRAHCSRTLCTPALHLVFRLGG